MESLEDNIRENLDDLAITFQTQYPTQFMKKRIDKLDFTKCKNFHSAKDSMYYENKKASCKWGKVFFYKTQV